MKKIELVKGIESSVIGFGCASVLGAKGPREAKKAIETSIECGVNHFDLARSYGYGEAEEFLGKILSENRQKFVIASKFGIRANWKAKILSPLKSVFRIAKKANHFSKRDKSREDNPAHLASSNINMSAFFDRVPINVSEMKKSVEISLKKIGTDYLDYLFIHEPISFISNIDEIVTYAEKLKQEGKIRALGLAYMYKQAELHQDYIDRFDVLQFNNPEKMETYEEAILKRGNHPNIIFSPIRGGKPELSAKDKLIKLSDDFPKSVILCSMFNEKHIQENTSLFHI